jgi:hypothetical protein
MSAYYTQIVVRGGRPTQVLPRRWDALVFPPTEGGILVLERTSEAIDVRIIPQLADDLSRRTGRATLAIAADEGMSFWCKLYENGHARCEHNRLVGPRDWAPKPADVADVYALCSTLGMGSSGLEVHDILTNPRYERAVERHAALAGALGLPAFSPGFGYSRFVSGAATWDGPEPTRTLHPDLNIPLPEEPADLEPLARFQWRCRRAFGYLVDKFDFQELPPRDTSSFDFAYRADHLTVVIDGLSYGSKTCLYLIDREGRFLDLASLVERRDPERRDLCLFAYGQQTQIPYFAETLHRCAADLLAGDLRVAAPIQAGGDKVFGSDAGDSTLAAYGPTAEIRDAASARWSLRARKGLEKMRQDLAQRRPPVTL